jgi:hypothetical protein
VQRGGKCENVNRDRERERGGDIVVVCRARESEREWHEGTWKFMDDKVMHEMVLET